MVKYTFNPIQIFFCAVGFSLGFFFSDAIVGFIRGLGETGTPTETITSSLFLNGGVGLLAGIVIILLSVMLLKKFMGFIISVLIGIVAVLVLTGMGIIIPDPASLITGLL